MPDGHWAVASARGRPPRSAPRPVVRRRCVAGIRPATVARDPRSWAVVRRSTSQPAAARSASRSRSASKAADPQWPSRPSASTISRTSGQAKSARHDGSAAPVSGCLTDRGRERELLEQRRHLVLQRALGALVHRQPRGRAGAACDDRGGADDARPRRAGRPGRSAGGTAPRAAAAGAGRRWWTGSRRCRAPSVARMVVGRPAGRWTSEPSSRRARWRITPDARRPLAPTS